MLISTSQSDEVRVAIVKNQQLYDLDIERPGFEQKKANIYKGRISRVEPSLEAAFVDYGEERHGFLPFKEISRTYFVPEVQNVSPARISIRDAIREGQEVIVQIDKEERGNKGAALTTFISLAGSYLVLMPNNPRVGGISRRVEGKERDELRDIMHNLTLPEGMGVIIRTAGVGKSEQELRWDLEALLKQWEAIAQASSEHPAPFLIYQEGDTVMRAIRDYLRQDTVEILVDDPELFAKTKSYLTQVKPDFLNLVKLYENKIPLFSYYQVEKQIETAYQRIVHLPSGGAIVIDHTEALVSIDVNSAKATGGSDIEETAFNTNVEAAEEIARQLRLRDIGGLIVIDFIDMSIIRHQREVSKRLREALECDRARVQVGHITRFGLLEMSRQRLRPHIGAAIQVVCPRCDGQGTIRSIESLASSILLLVEEEAAKEKTGEIQAQLPIDLATYMLNEKREVLASIEKRQEVRVVIIPNQQLETPKFKIKRLRYSEAKSSEASHKLIEVEDITLPEKPVVTTKETPTPAVRHPLQEPHESPSLLTGVKHFIDKIFKPTPKKQPPSKPSEKPTYKPQQKNVATPAATTTAAATPTPGETAEPRKFRDRGTSSQHRGRRQRHNEPRKFKPNEERQERREEQNFARRPHRSPKKHFTPPDTDSYPEITGERLRSSDNFFHPNTPTPVTEEENIFTHDYYPKDKEPTSSLHPTGTQVESNRPSPAKEQPAAESQHGNFIPEEHHHKPAPEIDSSAKQIEATTEQEKHD